MRNKDKDNLDTKITLTLTNNYYDLYENGEITKEQLDKVLDLIEDYKSYKPEEFQEKIQNIFKGNK